MKALTPAMIEMLLDCHERELQHRKPYTGISQTQSTKGLLKRGLLSVSTCTNSATGNIYMAYFITGTGKAYLKKYLLK